jgi:hypothetical protein
MNNGCLGRSVCRRNWGASRVVEGGQQGVPQAPHSKRNQEFPSHRLSEKSNKSEI